MHNLLQGMKDRHVLKFWPNIIAQAHVSGLLIDLVVTVRILPTCQQPCDTREMMCLMTSVSCIFLVCWLVQENVDGGQKRRGGKAAKASRGAGRGRGRGRGRASAKEMRFNPDDPLGLNSDDDAATATHEESLSQIPLASRYPFVPTSHQEGCSPMTTSQPAFSKRDSP